MSKTGLQKEPRNMQCQRCGHSWFYTGVNKFICSCPHCKTTLMVNPKGKNKKSLYTDELGVASSSNQYTAVAAEAT
jgi:DNA-directed RNA polymerase subunit RPC12/RpoP